MLTNLSLHAHAVGLDLLDLSDMTLSPLAKKHKKEISDLNEKLKNDLPKSSAGDSSLNVTGRKHAKLFNKKLKATVPFTHKDAKTEIVAFGMGGTLGAETTNEASYDPAKGAMIGEIVNKVNKPSNTKIIPVDVGKKDSKNHTYTDMVKIRRAILNAIEKGHKRIVVTHGSDTMEDTARFLHWTLPQDKIEGVKIILVGSMRSGDLKSSEARTNLQNALHFAKNDELEGSALVIMKRNNKEPKEDSTCNIYSPPDVSKQDSKSMDAIRHRTIPRIGKINGSKYTIEEMPETPPKVFQINENEPELPDVPRHGGVHTGANLTAELRRLERLFVFDTPKAYVFDGAGNGGISDGNPSIEKFLKTKTAEVAIIRASSAATGPVTHNGGAEDDEHGFISSGRLSGRAAALLVQLALADAKINKKQLTVDDIRTLFKPYRVPPVEAADESSPGTEDHNVISATDA